MSSINNPPKAPSNQISLQDQSTMSSTQTGDLSQINSDQNKFDSDLSSGNKSAYKGDIKALQADFKKAHSDGFSNSNMKSMNIQAAVEREGSNVAGHLDHGGKADDPKTVGYVRNSFEKWAKNNGKPADQAAWQQYQPILAKSMSDQGATPDQIEGVMTAASNVSHKPLTVAQLLGTSGGPA